MKLSAIFKKLSFGKSAAKPSRFKFSNELALWVVLAIIVLAELYVGYTAVWKNIIFSDEIDPRTVDAAVRINFDNYNRVTERLSEVEDFEVAPAIDFSGNEPGVGRSNPFSDPQ
jgi:hypothetical protein